jgi:hypothetical protein
MAALFKFIVLFAAILLNKIMSKGRQAKKTLFFAYYVYIFGLQQDGRCNIFQELCASPKWPEILKSTNK